MKKTSILMTTIITLLLFNTYCGLSVNNIRDMEKDGKVKDLLALLSPKEDSWKQEYASRSIANLAKADKLGDQKAAAVEKLIALLKDDEVKPFVKSEAALALGFIGDEKMIPVIESQVLKASKQPELLTHFMMALDMFPRENVEHIVQEILNRDVDNILVQQVAAKILSKPYASAEEN